MIKMKQLAWLITTSRNNKVKSAASYADIRKRLSGNGGGR